MQKAIMSGSREDIEPVALSDYRETCSWLGHAISVWALLESELAFLYAVTLGTKELILGAEAFYAVPSFEGKLRITDAVMCTEFRREKDIIDKWKNTRKRLSKAQQKRNQLAHGRVVSRINTDTSKVEHYRGTYLIPFYGELRANQGLSAWDDEKLVETLTYHQRIDAQQLSEFVKLFEGHTAEIRELTGEALAAKRFRTSTND